jgi:hypothetical protein
MNVFNYRNQIIDDYIGASAINCWWDQVKDLINISLHPNLASTNSAFVQIARNYFGQKELRGGRQH